VTPATSRFLALSALTVTLTLALVAPAAWPQTLYQLRVTDLNRVGLSVTNYGFFGNNFVSRAPSCEYPLGLGFEHMSRGGIWVGALAITDSGEVHRVSTAALDNYQGSNQAVDTEWTPLAGGIVVRSNLSNSRYYNPDAISEQDLVTAYRDRPARSPQGVDTEPHVPLGVRVSQSVYSFSIEPASSFVILHLTLINEGPLLRDLYAGMYTQLVSGDKNLYSVWPPSATSGPGSWYYRHYADYVDSLCLVREHYCDGLTGSDVPEDCLNFSRAPYWAGVKLLGTRSHTAALDSVALARGSARFRLWNWDPSDTTRDTDAERFALMAQPGADPPHLPGAAQFSPIELLSFGPIELLPAGDSLSVDFAFVFGATQAELAENASFAQFAFELEYRLPKPPPSPRLHLRPAENRVTLLWDDSSELAVDETSPQPGGHDFEGYRLYLGTDRDALRRVAQFDVPDTAGFNTGLDVVRLPAPEVIDGDTVRYAHTVDGLRDGFSYFAAITAFDTGDWQVPSLESGVSQNKQLLVSAVAPGERPGRGVAVFPNPYKVEAAWDQGTLVRDHYLWFANLPARCQLSIFTLAGDLVYETDFDGATYHGADARGLYDPRSDLDVDPPSLSGSAYAWNLISREGQAVASGIYLFAVRDAATGEVQRGKFLVIKSDREGL
jgi:hypothetical protein